MKNILKPFVVALCGVILASCCQKPAEVGAPHPEWTYNTVVYEMNVRQYTPEGTLAAAAKHLPRLDSLGVDIVWLMPVHPIGVKERKGTLGSYYAISDYCAINPEFGTLEDFQGFLDTAHGLGLKVIIDWVANHTSPDAKWINEKPADWYVRDSLGNTIVQYDWTDIAKLNYDNEEMRREMVASMRFWMERGVDGLRCDMAMEVPIDFWQSAFAELREEYPEAYFLAEGENPVLHENAFDASYAWELHHLLNSIARGEKGVAELKEYIAKDAEATAPEAFRLMFTSNHDENSWAGTEFERMGDAVRAMALLTFTLPRSQPLIYTGQEMGFNHRFEFFEKDHIPSWERNTFTDFYRELCALRHDNAALAAGERGGKIVYPKVKDLPENVMLFSREVEGNKVLVAANLSTEVVSFTLPEEFQSEIIVLPAWGYAYRVNNY